VKPILAGAGALFVGLSAGSAGVTFGIKASLLSSAGLIVGVTPVLKRGLKPILDGVTDGVSFTGVSVPSAGIASVFGVSVLSSLGLAAAVTPALKRGLKPGFGRVETVGSLAVLSVSSVGTTGVRLQEIVLSQPT
jgi:uncharacterized membrane protein